MKSDRERMESDRRGFLKMASVGAVLGGAAAVASPAQAAEEPARNDGQYQETAHVKRYYELAKF